MNAIPLNPKEANKQTFRVHASCHQFDQEGFKGLSIESPPFRELEPLYAMVLVVQGVT
jgi:hypothetical protein